MANRFKQQIVEDIQDEFVYDILGDMNPFKKTERITLDPPNMISDIFEKDRARRSANRRGPVFKMPKEIMDISDLVRQEAKAAEGGYAKTAKAPVKLARGKLTKMY